jgi:hypothetical protein
MPRPGERRIVRDITYDEWIGGANAQKFATREQVVAFWNLALREQVVPLMQLYLARYERERQARRWDRRLARWLGDRLARWLGRTPRVPSRQDLETLLAEANEPAPSGPTAPLAPAPPRTCVVCGTAQCEPIDGRGGLRCANGHILEEPTDHAGGGGA